MDNYSSIRPSPTGSISSRMLTSPHRKSGTHRSDRASRAKPADTAPNNAYRGPEGFKQFNALNLTGFVKENPIESNEKLDNELQNNRGLQAHGNDDSLMRTYVSHEKGGTNYGSMSTVDLIRKNTALSIYQRIQSYTG